MAYAWKYGLVLLQNTLLYQSNINEQRAQRLLIVHDIQIHSNINPSFLCMQKHKQASTNIIHTFEGICIHIVSDICSIYNIVSDM